MTTPNVITIGRDAICMAEDCHEVPKKTFTYHDDTMLHELMEYICRYLPRHSYSKWKIVAEHNRTIAYCFGGESNEYKLAVKEDVTIESLNIKNIHCKGMI